MATFGGLPIPAFVETFLSNLATGFANAKFTITFTSVIAGVLSVSFSVVGAGRLTGQKVTFDVPSSNAGAGLSFLIAVIGFALYRHFRAGRSIAAL